MRRDDDAQALADAFDALDLSMSREAMRYRAMAALQVLHYLRVQHVSRTDRHVILCVWLQRMALDLRYLLNADQEHTDA